MINHVYEPLISKELFDKVQKVLKTKKKERFRKEQKYAGIPFVFRGLIACKCGCTITPEHHKKGNKEYVYLRCSHQRATCNQKLVNENTILEQLDREISVYNKLEMQIIARKLHVVSSYPLNTHI